MARGILHFLDCVGVCGKEAGKQRPGRRPRSLVGGESLEDRKMMAHLAMLDFDGASMTAAQMVDGQWGAHHPEALTGSSFKSLFTSANPLLDVNGDNQVNQTDAQLAINQIVAKVRQDYSPYDLTIVVGNLSDRPAMLTDSQVGDVMVVITGGTNIINSVGANGIAPHADLGNERDEIAWVFGKASMSTMISADQIINSVARTISHEMGHCFGLGHITATPAGMADAHSHAMMGVEVDASNPAKRDYAHDFVFQDITYQTDALTGRHSSDPRFNVADQNAHRYLSDAAVLGPASHAWIAMLKPGELTVNGDAAANTINVTQSFTNTWFGIRREHWTVTATSLHTFTFASPTRSFFTTVSAKLQPWWPSIHSLNPYDAVVSKILINGQGGNDTITVSPGITAALIAQGGAGNDTITGGAGHDQLFGNDGNDRMFGGDGNDLLQGGRDSDEIHGQAGNDSLYGDTGLSDDGVVDYLYGELGSDTFYQKRSRFFLSPIVADSFVDYNAAEDAIVRFDGLIFLGNSKT